MVFIDKIWRVLISVRLTITLLVGLTFFSVVGSLIAQQGTAMAPLETIYSPTTLKWLVKFGLVDIFHSGYFVAGILALALNLIACSIERLPNVWRQAFHTPPKPAPDAVFGHWSPEQMRTQKFVSSAASDMRFASVNEARAMLKLFWQRQGAKKLTFLNDTSDGFETYLERGRYSRLGVYITHLSLLVIMGGAVIGALFGFEGAMQIEENTRSAWIQHNKGSRLGMKPYRENGLPLKGLLGLPFEVECEQFTLETYDGSRPKLFKSVLNFYENDVKVATREIAVNHPTVYKGLTFYQASFSEVSIGKATLRVYRVSNVGATENRGKRQPSSEKAPSLVGEQLPPIDSVERVEGIKVNDLYRVDGDAAFKIIQIEKNLMDLGPAVRLQYFASKNEKKPQEFWIFKNLPGFDFAHRKGNKLHFVLEDVRPIYATGLSVARDPGVWVVWVGCGILVLALFLALYTHHSRLWVRYSESKGLQVVGWSNKLFLFEPRFEKLSSQLRDFLKKELNS